MRGAFLGFERFHLLERTRGIGFHLDAIDLREHLAHGHAIALGDRQRDDLAHHAGADVGVLRRHDFTGRCDRRTEAELASGDPGVDRRSLGAATGNGDARGHGDDDRERAERKRTTAHSV
ncbi:MAG: hypothetical protein QM736_09250 [Vicinamibacterales bacterium]